MRKKEDTRFLRQSIAVKLHREGPCTASAMDDAAYELGFDYDTLESVAHTLGVNTGGRWWRLPVNVVPFPLVPRLPSTTITKGAVSQQKGQGGAA